MKKLIISERQYKMLTKLINENSKEVIIGRVLDDLNRNYKKTVETYRDGNDYKERKMFEVVVDGELITPRDLLDYIIDKYTLGEKFAKQFLNDWCNDSIVDNNISKNISLNT